MKKILRDYTFVIIGSFFVAAGLDLFLVPFNLSSGGVGTLGTILLHLFKIPLSVTNLACNAVLFVLGYRFLGKNSVLKTVVGILFLSVSLEITSYIPKFSEDIIFCCVCGGILDGIGIGLIVKVEGSTGGSDFACLILKRFSPHIPMSILILVVNGIILLIAGIVFQSYLVAFYSTMAIYVSSKITDGILNIGDAAKSIQIISEKQEEIKQIILQKFERGVTEFYSRGAYSGEEKRTLLCIVKPKEAPKLIKEVHAIDRNAFIVISDAKEVLGEGFKSVTQ